MNRMGYLGASDAPTIMGDDMERLLDLFEVKAGIKESLDLNDPNVNPDTWSQILIGQTTEKINLTYRPNIKVKLCDDDDPFIMNDIVGTDGKPFILARPDAISLNGDPIDAKHTHAFKGNFDTIEERMHSTYYWQMQQQMMVLDRPKSCIFPIYGNKFGDVIEITADPFNQAQLKRELISFWNCVLSKTPPEKCASVNAEKIPVPQDKLRTINLEEQNFGPEIQAVSQLWIDTSEAKAIWAKTDKKIKTFIADDVGLATGYGIQIKRQKNNALRITEVK